MAADQSPSNAKNVVWVNFLGIETAFLHDLRNFEKKIITRFSLLIFKG